MRFRFVGEENQVNYVEGDFGSCLLEALFVLHQVWAWCPPEDATSSG